MSLNAFKILWDTDKAQKMQKTTFVGSHGIHKIMLASCVYNIVLFSGITHYEWVMLFLLTHSLAKLP